MSDRQLLEKYLVESINLKYAESLHPILDAVAAAFKALACEVRKHSASDASSVLRNDVKGFSTVTTACTDPTVYMCCCYSQRMVMLITDEASTRAWPTWMFKLDAKGKEVGAPKARFRNPSECTGIEWE